MIDIADGITSIEVGPDEIPHLVENALVNLASQEHPPAFRHPTGARVTVEFARNTLIPPKSEVRLYYDIAENGGLRVIVGVPLLTHTAVRQGCRGLAYCYRLSHWIAACGSSRLNVLRHAWRDAARHARGSYAPTARST